MNIVFFTSLKRIYAALGGEYDNTIYKDQTVFLLIKFQKFIKSINMKKKVNSFFDKMSSKSRKMFLKYNKSINFLHEPEKNINVIEPNSSISSYMMMRRCDKVITYESLTGIEAVYWKKPSIVLEECMKNWIVYMYLKTILIIRN